MRTTKLTILATALTAIGLSACGTSRGDTAATDDFKRDLQLASATNMNLAAPKVDPALLTLESAPRGAPQPAPTLKRAPGPKAVQSEAPTVEAAPEPEPAAVEVEEPVATTVEQAPAPESTEPVAVAPRPAPVPAMPAGNGGVGDYGRGGGVFGGGIGVVIRGGGVGGHGDNCEIRPRRGGVIFTSPVYVPRPFTPRIGGGR